MKQFFLSVKELNETVVGLIFTVILAFMPLVFTDYFNLAASNYLINISNVVRIAIVATIVIVLYLHKSYFLSAITLLLLSPYLDGLAIFVNNLFALEFANILRNVVLVLGFFWLTFVAVASLFYGKKLTYRAPSFRRGLYFILAFALLYFISGSFFGALGGLLAALLLLFFSKYLYAFGALLAIFIVFAFTYVQLFMNAISDGTWNNLGTYFYVYAIATPVLFIFLLLETVVIAQNHK